TAQPRNAATGVAATVKLAGGGNLKPYPTGYKAGLMQLPRFKAGFEVDESGFTGRSNPAAGTIAWAPSTKVDLSALAAYFWPDAAIAVTEGPEETGVFAARLTGKVVDALVRDQKLQITLADYGADLDKPLITARFLGTGGVEGARGDQRLVEIR